jgi:1,4-dihydroxy-2-naphthoyl-CoA hydrolase
LLTLQAQLQIKMVSGARQSLWAGSLTLEEIRRRYLGDCDRNIGVELTAIGPDWLEGRVPAAERTRDSYGDSCGGAVAILAEALGSIASNLCLADDARGVGQSLEVHRFLSVTSGSITGRASPVSITSSTHIWRIDMRDEATTLVGTASLSMVILGLRTRGVIPSSSSDSFS